MITREEENDFKYISREREESTEKLNNIDFAVADPNAVKNSDRTPLFYLKSSENMCVQNYSYNGNLLNESPVDFQCNNFNGLVSIEIEGAELLPHIEDPKPIELMSNFNELNMIKADSFGPMESLRKKQLPSYLSLSKEFLNDEPPKYELITGKQLKTQLKYTPSTSTSEPPPEKSWKKKLIVLIILLVLTVVIVIFFVLGKKLSSRRDSYS